MAGINVHEVEARLRKAHALAEAFLVHLDGLGVELTADLAVELAQRAPLQLWLDLAESEGIRPPSTETVAVVVRSVRAAMARRVSVAEMPFMTPEELFSGLT